MRRPPVDKLLFAALLLVGLALGVALIGIDVPDLEAEVTALAAERAGIRLESDSFRFDLRHGLVAREVEARAEIAGDRLVARIPRLILSTRLAPLVRGEVVIEEMRIESPSIEILSRSPGGGEPDLPAPGERSSRAVRLELERVLLTGGRLVSRMEDGAGGTSEVDGLELELLEPRLDGARATGLAGLTASGRFAARRLAIDGHALADVGAPLEAERGRFRTAGFEIWSGGGRIAVERLEVDLAQSPYRYRIELRVGGIDLGRRFGVGEGFGPLALEVAGAGEGPGLPGAVAEMSVDLAAGRLPALPVLARLDAAFGTELAGAAYEAARLEISLAEGELVFEPGEIVTEQARLGLSGTITLDGEWLLGLEVAVRGGELGVPALSDPVLEALSDRNGWVRLPIRVSGRPGRLHLTPDGAALQRLLARRGATTATAAAVRSELGRSLALP